MKLGEFSMAGPGAQQEALLARLKAFNNTAAEYPRDKTVHEVFCEQAARSPDAVAVLDGAGAVHTYREVDDLSDRLARFLIGKGLRREEPVGVMLDKAFELTVGLLGILKAGGAYCPVESGAPFSRMRFILEDTGARFLISEKKYIRILNKLQWECRGVSSIVCPDSPDIHSESEGEGAMMQADIWNYVGEEMFDDISGGGWTSSYTGEWLSRAVMDEYGENIRQKLDPYISAESRVLEVACSTGISLFRLAPKSGLYVGTDMSARVLAWTAGEVARRGLMNVRLRQLKADEVDRIEERGFDVVILNSVVQCFPGYNYLRMVLRKCIGLMADRGVIFLGNLWDLALKDDFVRSLVEFRRSAAGGGCRTKIDRSEELFVGREFLEDLLFDIPGLAGVEVSRMLGCEKSELSEFGYDAIIRVDRQCKAVPAGSRRKFQYDARLFDGVGGGRLPGGGGAADLAYIMYTSGTTGQPKGTLIEHRSVLRLVLNTNYVRLGPEDRVLQTGSLAFDASTFEIWGMLLNGGSFCRPGGHAVIDRAEMARLIRDLGVTTLFLTTSLFNQYAEDEPGMFAGLRTLLTGGEKVSVKHINAVRRACPDLALGHVYGPTENTTFSTWYPVEACLAGDVPIGKPISNSTVYILDAAGRPVPVGVPGEICTGGDGVARGYLNRAELTAAKFVSDRFAGRGVLYRTGDLGYWQEDGNVVFAGRLDNQVKIRGFRVEPGEVESAIRQFPAVGEVVVIARAPDSAAGGSVELVCYFTAKVAVSADDLRGYLKSVLPDYMVPAYFVKLDRMPLTANGKVDKAALPDVGVVEGCRAGGGVGEEPVDETERRLVSIWEEVLGHRGIGTGDNFFDIGGHSLKVVKLVSLIQGRLGVSVPLGVVFKAATIRELAGYIMDQARFGSSLADELMVMLGRGRAGRKLFAFPPGTGDVLSYVALAELLEGYSVYAFNFLEAADRLSAYADQVVSVDGAGPYVLVGYSSGGNLAYRVACELESRGKSVSAIIMLDSARVLGKIRFPEGEVEKVTELFLGHESIRPYVASSVLRDKAARRIRSYYEYMQEAVDDRVTGADVHVLVSESPAELDAAFPVSVDAWAGATRGVFRTYKAAGLHNDMLYQPALGRNAELMKQVLAGCR